MPSFVTEGRSAQLWGRARSIEPLKHSTLALVALAYAALAFADGGYPQKVVAGATIGVWLVVAIGIVARVGPARHVPRRAIAAGGCLAGLLLLSALSMLWANDAGRTFVALVRVSGYLGLFTLVVLAAPASGPRAWLVGLAAGLTIVCGAALATRFDPSLFGGGDRELGLALPSAAGRLSYPIGYWNGLAACLAIQGVLLVWLGTHARTRLGRAAGVALLPLPVLAVYLTSSRGGLAAVIAGGLVLLALERARPVLLGDMVLGAAGGGLLVLLARTRGDFLLGLATPTARHEGLEMGLATLVCVLGVGIARYLLDEPLTRARLPSVRWRLAAPALVTAAVIAVVAVNPVARVHEFTSPNEVGSAAPGQGHLLSAGGSDRYQYWKAAVEAFASRPVTGIGAGNYQLYWNAHPQVALPLVNAHSLYLENLAELGIVGLALVLGFFAVPALTALKRATVSTGGEVAAALAVLAAGAVTAALEWSWQIPAALTPVVIAAGLITAPRARARLALVDPADARPPGRFGLGIATLGIAWASIWAAGVVFVTNLKLDASHAAAARGDLVQAADDARDAAGVQPWSPEPRLQLALVEELAGNPRTARTSASEAIDRASGDWRPWAVAARIDARAGDLVAASEEIDRAKALSPVRLPHEFVAPIRREAEEKAGKRGDEAFEKAATPRK